MIYPSPRSFALAILVASVGTVSAQEASVSDQTTGSAPSAAASAASGISPAGPDSSILPGDQTVSVDPAVETEAGTVEGESGFFFPGGYGYLPEKVSSLGGIMARPPINFNFTLQQGYNDNIYSASGEPIAPGLDTEPVKGSFVTTATVGTDILLSKTRTFLSLGMNVGGVYYWDKAGDPFSPTGRLNLAYAYKVTPRLDFTARVTGGYFDQPDLSVPNSPARVNAGDYFQMESHFNLLYRWTPRIATDTSFGASTQIFRESSPGNSDYVLLHVGQSVRYIASPRLTGVLEVRGSQSLYDDENRNSTSEFLLLGSDFQLNPKLNGTFRTGVEFRQFEEDSREDKAVPYFESTLGYRYGRGSVFQWTNRYGFEESYTASQSNRSLRTGFRINQVLTPRLNAVIGFDYSYQMLDGFGSTPDTDQSLITGSFALNFIVSRSVTVFGSYKRSQVITDASSSSFDQNQVFLGASYNF